MANESNPAQPAPAPSSNYIDDLFDYDVGLDDILRETTTNTNNTSNAPREPVPPDNAGVVLGLDEEVKVTKKRQPVAKLDESRLLSQAGIPKLRRAAKKNLKFKGKGHEFSDLARLLNFYQLWLDDLFPRAKFADGLAIIERLGHSRRMQTMRKEWIDAEKPRPAEDDSSDRPQINQESPMGVGNNNTTGEDVPTAGDLLPTDQMDVDESPTPPRSPRRTDDGDEELFISDGNNKQQRMTDDGRAQPDDDDFDELDALLREHEDDNGAGNNKAAAGVQDLVETESHADELEAMEGLGLLGDIPSYDLE